MLGDKTCTGCNISLRNEWNVENRRAIPVPSYSMELDRRAKHHFGRNDDETDPRVTKRGEQEVEAEEEEEEKRIERFNVPPLWLHSDKPFHRVMRPRLAIGVKRSVMRLSISLYLRSSAIYTLPLPLFRHAFPLSGLFNRSVPVKRAMLAH